MRVAIVGLGVIGKVHAQILQKLGYEIAGVCDIKKKKFADLIALFKKK